MNILFCSGYFGSTPIANNVIALRLSEAFQARGHRCFILGLSTDCIGTEPLASGATLTRIPAAPFLRKSLVHYYQFQQQHPDTTAKEFALRHPLDAALIGFFNQKCYNNIPKSVAHYTKEVTRLVECEHIDAVITMCFPFDVAHHVLSNLTANVKKLYYQLDPHGLHVYYHGAEHDLRVKLECEAMSHADLTFTTFELYPQYQAHTAYQPYLNKIMPIGFPVFFPPKEGDFARSGLAKDKINVVFCGNLDPAIRDPAIMLGEIEKILQRTDNIKFYFVGRHPNGFIETLATQYPDQFVLVGSVGAEDADNFVNCADVLLNIGNIANNMVPSKIFTAFATGKPILNFQKIDDCPNEKYFARYPLAYTFYETRDIDKANKTTEMIAFIQNNAHTRLPYAKTEQVFCDYTLDGVAEQMLHHIDQI